MINIGQYIESAINWMMVHFSTFFDRLVAYPISTAVSKTICLNSSLISLAPFKPLETVLTDTPRRFAISLIVAKSLSSLLLLFDTSLII